MIGVTMPRARITRVAAIPSIAGKLMSIRIRSNSDDVAASTASSPVSTVVVVASAFLRMNSVIRPIVFESSTMSMRADILNGMNRSVSSDSTNWGCYRLCCSRSI